MASSAKKVKTNPVSDSQLQLLYGDDAITKYWSSSLFNTVYLRHDISDKHSCWKDEDDLDFQNFMNTLRNIAAEYKDREKELSNWSETETINNLVKHMLHALGWTNNCTGVQNPFLEETSFRYDGKTYRTDILIVDHPKEKQYVNQAKGDDKLKEARQSILMPIEVKYWQRLEEYRQGKKEEKDRTDNESDDIARTTTPNEQTIQYMDILKKNWGILTDGAKWRLFNTELSSEDAERYYEFNFASLFQAMTTEETEADSLEVTEAAKYFYHFFSKFAFYPKNEAERPFVDEVLQYSKKYVNKVEENLKERFVKAMNIACNGLFKSAEFAGQSQDHTVIRNVSESALFNILFTKSLESRGILPMASTDYKKISLTNIIDKIERFDPEKEDLLNTRELERAFKKGNGNSFFYKPDGNEVHDRIIRLTGVIHKGASAKDNFGFEISGFRESVFSDPEWKIFKTCKISNRDWVRILFELGYAESESLNRKYQQIPYAYFTPRQLGSIYESFLEFKIEKSNQDMVYEKKQWKSLKSIKSKKTSSLPIVKTGELFFTPDNEERKASGSYYTPEYAVRYILDRVFHDIEKLSANEILSLRICDPASGSGHFLNSALKFLTQSYLNAVSKTEMDSKGNIENSKTVRSKILHNCIFGVDLNPRAIKLAKMSLWLETASAGSHLEDLSDQLKIGDSLVGKLAGYGSAFDWKKEFFDKGAFGFDAVIGNPPYVKPQRHSEEISNYLHKNYLCPDGKADLYMYFIELAGKIISKKGRVGLITPSQWINVDAGAGLRELISTNQNITEFVDFGDLKVFVGVSTYPSITIIDNSAKQKSFKLKLVKHKDELSFDKIKSAKVRDIKFDSVGKEPWNFSQVNILGNVENSKEFLEMRDVIVPCSGVTTGFDEAFILSKSEVTKFNIEKTILVPFICKGANFKEFGTAQGNAFLIFPYISDGEKYKLIQKNDFKKNYPNAFALLEQNKEGLLKRKDSRKSFCSSEDFHKLLRPGKVELKSSRKFILKGISKYFELGFADKSTLSNGNYPMLLPVSQEEASIYFYYGVLNSSITKFYMRSVAQPLQGGYRKYNPQMIGKFLIPKYEFVDKKIRDKIAKLSKEIESGSKSKFKLKYEIDAEVARIYKLNSDELEAICESVCELNESTDSKAA